MIQEITVHDDIVIYDHESGAYHHMGCGWTDVDDVRENVDETYDEYTILINVTDVNNND